MSPPSQRRRALAGFVALAALVIAACGVQDPAEPAAPPPPADDDAADDPDPGGIDDAADSLDDEPVLSVVATVAPVADLVAQVGGDRVQVTSLVPAGADSHTYEPRPGDVARLADADAYLGIGLGLNDAALRLAEEAVAEGSPVVRLGEGLPEDTLVRDHVHDHGDDGHTHGDDGHSHGDDGHTHGDEPGPNPHVWTSVRNAIALVDGIQGVLTDLDPDGADGYAQRAAALRRDLQDLDRSIGEAAATIPGANRTLITYHDAWTYFARDHDLVFVTAVQPADFSEPSAAEIRAVIDLVREHDVPAVFGSEVFPSSVLKAIAEETGAVYVGDLADDVLPGELGDADHSYVGLMRRNAATIIEALGGDVSALAD